MTRQDNYFTILAGLDEILEAQELRDSQRKVLQEFMENPTDNLQGIFDLATAFGKTRLMKVLTLAYLHANPKGKIVLATPTIDTVEQTKEKFCSYSSAFNEKTVGMYYSKKKEAEKKKEADKSVVITTYHSLKKLTSQIKPEDVGVLLLDEAHHAITEKRTDTIQQYTNACWYGLTGTPGYSPDKDLANLIGNVIASVDVPQAVQEGSLTSLKNILLLSNLKVDLSQVQREGQQREYNQQQYEQAFKEAMAASTHQNVNEIHWEDVHREIAKGIALFYQQYVDDEVGVIEGKKCIINCRTQAEARIQAEELNKLFGKNIAAVWTSETQTISDINEFKNGKCQIVCQVGKLNEGFDMPNLDVCINYPTASKVLEKQRGGRVLRLNPADSEKTALIVDIAFPGAHAGNSVEATHQNGQVLYCDVIGIPVVHTPHHQRETINPRVQRENKQVQIPGFSIVSRPKELLRMYQSARGRENIYADMIPLEEYAKGGYVDKEVLESHCQKLLRTTFEDEYGNERPLVQVKQKKGETLYFVTSNELGLEKLNSEMRMLNYLDGLKELSTDVAEINKYISDNGMDDIKPYIVKAILKSPTYKDSSGNILPVIELKKGEDGRSKPKAYVRTNTRALDALMEATCEECDDEETVKKIREKFDEANWISLGNISAEFNLSRQTIRKRLFSWVNSRKSYEIENSDGTIEKKKVKLKWTIEREPSLWDHSSEKKIFNVVGPRPDLHALQEADKNGASYYLKETYIPRDAVNDFLSYMSREGNYFYSYRTLPMILTAPEIAKKLGVRTSIVEDWLKKCALENRQFERKNEYEDGRYLAEYGNIPEKHNVVLRLRSDALTVKFSGLGVHQDGWDSFKSFLEEKGLYSFAQKEKQSKIISHNENIEDSPSEVCIAEDLRKKYSFANLTIPNRLLEEMHYTFHELPSGEKVPVSEYIEQSDGTSCLALTKPWAIDVLEEKYPVLKLPLLRSGMVTSREFTQKYGLHGAEATSFLKKLYKENKTFKDEKTGKTFPYVEKVRDKLDEVYAFNENVTFDMLLKIISPELLDKKRRSTLRKRLEECSSVWVKKDIVEELKEGRKKHNVYSSEGEKPHFRQRLANRLRGFYKERDEQKTPLTIKEYITQKKEKV